MIEQSDPDLESFYAYRSLLSDESWGAILSECHVSRLSNIDFGMRVYAKNEKEAISKARRIYDEIHKHDIDKENLRRFAASALKTVLTRYNTKILNGNEIKEVAGITMKIAIALNKEFNSCIKLYQNKDV